MDFEYDQTKSRSNRAKHGIDFEQAQAVWDDTYMLEVAARTGDEARWVAVGRIGPTHWSAVFTWRAGSVRLISVRRARENEIALYEG